MRSRSACGREWKSGRVVAAIAAAVLLMAVASGAASAAGVAVVESATAQRWLAARGVAATLVPAREMETADLTTYQVLVLPLDAVRTPGAARAVEQYLARGGRLLAVGWGPLVGAAQQSRFPVYGLTSTLGATPTGWQTAGVIHTRAAGDQAASPLRLQMGMIVRVVPTAARPALVWARRAAVLATGEGEGVLAVEGDGYLWLTAALFVPANDGPGGMDVLALALERLRPGIALGQVREQIGALNAQIIRTEAELRERSNADEEAARKRSALALARATLDRARAAALAGEIARAAGEIVLARQQLTQAGVAVEAEMAPRAETPDADRP